MCVELGVANIELNVRGDEAHAAEDLLAEQPYAIPDKPGAKLNRKELDLILDGELAEGSGAGDVFFMHSAVPLTAHG